MVLGTLKRILSGPLPVIVVVILLLASLTLMSAATQNSVDFGRLYSSVVIINLVALLLLVSLILRNLIHLVGQYRRRAPGSRLTVRLVAMFVMLSLAPVTVVFYFSLEFLQRGIDSWFDVRVERALKDALEIGRTALDATLSDHLDQTRNIAGQLSVIPQEAIARRLSQLRKSGGASAMMLLTQEGHLIVSSTDAAAVIPSIPNTSVLVQLRKGLEYAAIEPTGAGGLQMRIVIPVDGEADVAQRLLHVIYPVPERLSLLAEGVQSAFSNYNQLAYLRGPLKGSFTLTLSLVLLLSLFTAVWAAFSSARRLVAPIKDLAEGTRAVAAGDYDKRLPLPGNDELGFLVQSFNEMTRRIALSRDQARRSQRQVETQRAYLETVLGRLSSGVLTVNSDETVRTANTAAGHILGVDPETLVSHSLSQLAISHTRLEPLVAGIRPLLPESQQEWHTEVTLFGQAGRQVLICRGSSLPDEGETRGGHVIVFDDVTTLIQAQRDAAWGEVARRLAHEIKNPLTPIQLSAERLRHKYLQRMNAEDAEVLDRSTHTIVQQVESLKEMVKAFSEYAHTPVMRLQQTDLNRIINEVLELYRGDRRLRLHYGSIEPLPLFEADPGRLRQLLHNLVKNALEAGACGEQPVNLRIEARCIESDCRFVELTVSDDGPGIPEEMLGRLFEPYVTNKPKGTGLGLAIVKKIVEEHGGMLTAGNLSSGGPVITVRFPTGTRALSPVRAVNGME
jgi:nitrogen fixation/metabolism regulation signal transduction histidine kinase